MESNLSAETPPLDLERSAAGSAGSDVSVQPRRRRKVLLVDLNNFASFPTLAVGIPRIGIGTWTGFAEFTCAASTSDAMP